MKKKLEPDSCLNSGVNYVVQLPLKLMELCIYILKKKGNNWAVPASSVIHEGFASLLQHREYLIINGHSYIRNQ